MLYKYKLDLSCNIVLKSLGYFGFTRNPSSHVNVDSSQCQQLMRHTNCMMEPRAVLGKMGVVGARQEQGRSVASSELEEELPCKCLSSGRE